VRIVTLPGVFRPISDTWMLAEHLVRETAVRGGSVLDLCSGSGALGVAAARAGARRVTAIDLSRAAVTNARLNAFLNGVRVRALRGSLFWPVQGERFDVIVSNPPYVPSARDLLPARGRERAWEAGRDGRALLDPICAQAAPYLEPGGALLLVHSSACGERATLDRLAATGLEAQVAERRRGPLGPLMSARARELERRGALPPGVREEELLVIEGRARAQPREPRTGAGTEAVDPGGAPLRAQSR
jgi:release factor glutamine methyltransferase